MSHVRELYSGLWILLACSLASADTIPTLTANYAYLAWDQFSASSIQGPDFNTFVYNAYPYSLNYPCATLVPAGGCVAPGPALFYLDPAQLDYASEGGSIVRIGGNLYPVYFIGNAQIQYSTPTIVYPNPSGPFGGGQSTVPVTLVGSGTACLTPPSPSLTDPCADYNQKPGYPNYLANISINLSGALSLYTIGTQPGHVALEAFFTTPPIPEPGSIAMTCVGLLALAAARNKYRNS